MTETISTFALAWTAFGIAALSPGPNMFAVASRSIGAGRLSGQCVAIGIAIGAFVWAMFAVVGLDQVFARYPELPFVLGGVGGLYLVYLGLKGLRTAIRYKGTSLASVTTHSRVSDVCYGLLVTLTNPKVGLLWISLSLLVTAATETAAAKLVFASGAAGFAYLIYGGYGIFFSSRFARTTFDHYGRWAEALFGLAFCLFGAGLIWSIV